MGPFASSRSSSQSLQENQRQEQVAETGRKGQRSSSWLMSIGKRAKGFIPALRALLLLARSFPCCLGGRSCYCRACSRRFRSCCHTVLAVQGREGGDGTSSTWLVFFLAGSRPCCLDTACFVAASSPSVTF